MITERGLLPASVAAPRQPLKLRRGGALRVMLRPRAAARLLEDLAEHADTYRYATGVAIKACAASHVPRR